MDETLETANHRMGDLCRLRKPGDAVRKGLLDGAAVAREHACRPKQMGAWGFLLRVVVLTGSATAFSNGRLRSFATTRSQRHDAPMSFKMAQGGVWYQWEASRRPVIARGRYSGLATAHPPGYNSKRCQALGRHARGRLGTRPGPRALRGRSGVPEGGPWDKQPRPQRRRTRRGDPGLG